MLPLTFIGLVVGLVALIIGSLFDIKTREVPDWLNYSLIAFAVGSSLILAIYYGYSHIIVNALIGLGVGVAIGLLMFYTGQWGGGDSKLIMGLSALMGFSFSEFNTGVPLFFVFLINILLVGAIYGLSFSLVKALTNYNGFKQAAEEKLRSKKIFWVRVVLLIIAIAALVFLLASRSVESGIAFGLALSLFLFFYLWVFVETVEKTCMIKKIKLSQLTEGDWIVGNVMKNKKILLKPSKTGITLKQMELLKKHRMREITIKIGIPFVPSFLVAYILTFVFGNWLSLFL
jgi:Flp pilus assembly protein protease CpaA